jgi:hypothetical protein
MAILKEMRDIAKLCGTNRSYYLTMYFASNTSHARVEFNGYPILDLIEFIENMNSQGFKECTWFRWKWRQFKSWWNSRGKAVVDHQEMRAEISET